MRDNSLERATDLIRQMTLREKVAQMVQIPYSMVSREEALMWAERGVGSFLHVLGDNARELQNAALKTRLKIPVIFGIDAIHGHCLNENATIFPSQLAAACSWNRTIVEQMGRDTAREVATDGLHWTFSPVLCLGRDTRWGRIDETFGEDSYLAGEMGAAIIKGYQGKSLDDDESILACAKHYFGYGEAVGARDACDTEVTFRKAREVFLPPFKKAVDAGCATVMTAYGSIDGVPFTSSYKSLHTILRDEMGFDGLLVTDWGNIESLMTNQHVAENIEDASLMGAKAGNDMIMTTSAFYDAAINLVESGRLAQSVIDEAVLHILTVKFRMGLFEKPEKTGKTGCIGCQAHLDDALELARESVVLLKNDGVLPLDESVRRIAVIGPNANDIRAQYGDWTYFSHPLPNPEHEAKRPYVTLLEGVRLEAEKIGAQVVYSRGCDILPSENDDIPSAVNAARGADIIILALGDDIRLTGEGKDRANLALSGKQTELYCELRKLNIPIVTVLISSKPLCMGESAESASALIVGFNGGMFGGQALAEVIFGSVAPKGRLPISFPRHSGQLPVYYNSLPGWHGSKYCDLPETPLFAFGEGLGYTSFSFGDIEYNDESLTLVIPVKNVGNKAGIETVQIYLNDCVSSVLTPNKKLIAYKQIMLNPGDERRVEYQLQKSDFEIVNTDERYILEPGDFILMAGHSSKSEDLKQLRVCLRGEQ